MNKNTTIIYFSPTGNTKKSLEAMAEAVGECTETIDITVNNKFLSKKFCEEDFVIFGAPVYGGRIPVIAQERFAAIRGNNTPCLVVVTYGNRDFDDSLLELADMAKAQGFLVKGAAALVGRHTYGEIQVTRPDAVDLAADRDFAYKAFSKSNNSLEALIPGNNPYRDGGNGGKFRPLTSNSCIECGLCVRECPANAIDEDCKTIADFCISCFRCIRECAINAKNMNTDEYRNFAAMFTEKLKYKRENQYYL